MQKKIRGEADLSHEFDFISWIFGNDMKVKNYVKKKIHCSKLN